MRPDLELLDVVRWRGQEIAGRRPRALLAALVRHPEGLSDERLVAEVWADQRPASSGKALQVLVSRLRAQCGPIVERRAGGYRLTLTDEEVDALLIGRLTREATDRLPSDPQAAADAAERGLALLAGAADVTDEPLRTLLAEVGSHQRVLVRVRGLALAALGRAAEAYPLLVEAHRVDPDHVPTLVALLRAEASAEGVPAALDRYAAHRRDLADRLGVDPAPELQRVHRELLAADSPVRTGVRYDAGRLLGRQDDLARLRAACADARLVTVLGPGGIGKTSIAQVLAQESTMPRVHVVELVGVGPDDVVAEVGAALGVRDSITSRLTLTAAQQTDVRGRIAQELDAAPTLLVLDNCEHVLESVASLVAFLLVTTRDLRVLTTSRAPLRLGAERVVALSQLAEPDAVALFEQRATAVRPGALLEPGAVLDVVRRLDGLPLAVELAAARVRTLSVEQIHDLLTDRLALLRTRDRSTPDRHRTLGAVIEWSWDLLARDEQRALRWLATFQDGFSADAVHSMLGPSGSDLVEALVEQSLLQVDDVGGQARFRSLETIREFALLRLRETGEEEAALAARSRWAVETVSEHGSVFHAEDQLAAVDALVLEENNLTDVLRAALSAGDRELMIRLLESLGSLWTVTGNHPRLFALADAAEDLIVGWEPPVELRRATQEVAGVLLVHLSWMTGRTYDGLREAVGRWGDPESAWARAAYAMHSEPDDRPPTEALAALAAQEPDDEQRAGLLMWAALTAENSGDAATAEAMGRQALQAGPRSPYLRASIHAELAALAMAGGDYPAAAYHAEIAIPLLLRLHDHEDAHALALAGVVMAIDADDHERATELLDEAERSLDQHELRVGSRMLLPAARAEAAAAAGRLDEALVTYDRAVAAVAGVDNRSVGALPWLLFAATGALAVRARLLAPDQPERARELRDLLIPAGSLPDPDRLRHAELQVHGLQLVGVAVWALAYGSPETHDDGLRLLAIAKTWTYNAHLPSVSWANLVEIADRVRAGRADALLPEYAERPTRDVVVEARERLARITSFG